jgi:hypothetical protein
MIVPDSIQPVTGWKALVIRNGWLYSPQQATRWPLRQPLEAACSKAQLEYEWELHDTPAEWDEEEFWIPASFLREGGTTTFSWPASPAPTGKTWRPKRLPHNMQPCSCGIYVVETPQQCSYYLQGENRVLCEIALWGQTVIASQGARGQYAYPQKIVAARQQEELARPVAENYGAEIEIVTFWVEGR